MVQIKVTPYMLKDFQKKIKIFSIVIVIGILLSFFSETETQRNRFKILVVFYFVLLCLVLIAEKMFKKKINEKINLWLLYISSNLSILGFPILYYAVEDSLNMADLKESIVKIILSTVVIISVGYFIKLLIKYGGQKKIYTVLVSIFMLLVFLTPVIYIIFYDDFYHGIIYTSGILLAYSLIQLPKIDMYFKLKNIDRYGDSLSLIENKKKDDKK